MKLSNILLIGFLAFVAWLVIVLSGFGVAFAFSDKVLIPWLGVASQYHNIATLIGAWVFAGLGAGIVVVVAGLACVALFGLFRLLLGSRR